MEWAGVNDDFIPYNITRPRADAYAKGDYDYEFISWTGLAAEHLVMCKNGMWDLTSKWLGDQARAVDPHHVTYVRNPLMDGPESHLVGDRAYWLSRIETSNGDPGAIDVVSEGHGVTDPAPTPKTTTAGVQDGTFSPVNPYLREYRHPGDPVPAPAANVLDVRAANIGQVTIDPKRAGVDCDAQLKVATDGPLQVTLLGCDRTERFTGTDSGGLARPQTYRPADPLAPVGNPAKGTPLPPEVGNVPQPPLQAVPPLRFPPNTGGNPTPSGG